MLTPARSVANRTRVSTVPPFGMVILAIRKDSRSTKTSSTPTPRRMNIPTKLSDVEEAQKNILAAAKQLADDGKISLGGSSDDYV